MTDKQKQQIDDMDYESLLRLWRFSASGAPIFQGKAGYYFAKVMREKREELQDEEAIKISKSLGW